LQEEGYDISSAISALEKLAVLTEQHTFLSSHPNPKARAKLLLEDGDSEGEDQSFIFARLLEYGKIIVIGLINLVLSLVNWLISLWS
jgi:putative metalloprotease